MFRNEESDSSMQSSAPSAPVTVGAEYDEIGRAHV